MILAPLRSLDRFGLIGRFARDQRATAAVEFAMVAMPFFVLLFGIMQVALVMFANQVLQTMVSNAARGIMTGQMQGRTLADFRDAMCDPANSLFNCNQIYLQVKSFNDFSAANEFEPGSCFEEEALEEPTDCFEPGVGNDVVVVRALYEWPFGLTLESFNGTQVLAATAAFTNEPF